MPFLSLVPLALTLELVKSAELLVDPKKSKEIISVKIKESNASISVLFHATKMKLLIVLQKL